MPMLTLKNFFTLLSRLGWKAWATGIFLVLLFAYLLSIALAPLHTMHKFEKLAESDSLFLENYKDLYDQPQLSSLVKDKAYKEALLKLAEYDSIQLVINLSDSTVSLSIKGVVIHRSRAGTIHADRIFQGMPLVQQLKLLSQPLAVQAQYASIVKEPVVVREAPKDTLEAALNAWQPDTLLQNPAFVLLTLDEGIHVILEQEDNPALKDRWTRFGFYGRLYFKRFLETTSDFLCLKKQDYHPAIVLSVPVDELRAIYRALPGQVYVVIKL
jgi:hypothetical protein